MTKSTTSFEPGDVVLVRFPFTDLSDFKQRPVVVLSPNEYWSLHRDLIVMPITSQQQVDAQLALNDWAASGLLKPSWVKPLLASVTERAVSRALGRLSSSDATSIRHALRLMIDAQWLS